MSSVSYAYVKNLHTGEKSYLPIKKLVIAGDCLRTFNPIDENDFHAEEEYGVKTGDNVVLHYIWAMSDSLPKLKKKIEGQRVAFKKRIENSPVVEPLSRFIKEGEKKSMQSKQKLSKAIAHQVTQDQGSEVLRRQSEHIVATHNTHKTVANNSKGNVNSSKEGTSSMDVFPHAYFSAPMEQNAQEIYHPCVCDHSCETVKKFKQEIINLERKLHEMEEDNIDLLKTVQTLKMNAKAQVPPNPDTLLEKLIYLQNTVENIPAGVLALLKDHDVLSGSGAPKKETFDDVHVVVPKGKKYIGRGKFITLDQWEEAELKVTLSGRASKIADAILDGGLVAYNIKGPTAEHPELKRLAEEDILTVVSALNRMPWLKKTEVNAKTVAAALSKAAYELRRPAVKKNVGERKEKRKRLRMNGNCKRIRKDSDAGIGSDVIDSSEEDETTWDEGANKKDREVDQKNVEEQETDNEKEENSEEVDKNSKKYEEDTQTNEKYVNDSEGINTAPDMVASSEDDDSNEKQDEIEADEDTQRMFVREVPCQKKKKKEIEHPGNV